MSLVTGGQALILVGGPGTGKTARLDDAAAEAGGLVLRASGHRLETDIPFAGLHQLLRPVLDRADVLPVRQRAALGVLTGDGGPDRLLLGIAVLTLLSELGPVLLAVDDLQWLDPDSVRVLTFVARRLDGEPVALLGASHQAHFGLPHLEVGPPADVAVAVPELTAAELDEQAGQAVRRGAYGTAARLLARAGGGRRLLRAAELAILGGYPGWGLELLGRVEDPSLGGETALRRGQALALTPRRDAALRHLLDAAANLPEPLAGEAMDSAAVVAYYTGRREGVVARSLWARTLTDPASAAGLPDPPSRPDQLIAHATMAWLLDETSLAVAGFERAADLAELPDVLRCAAGWAYLESGRWAPARLVAAASARSAADGDLPHTAAAAQTLDATVLALQGDVVQARELATAALAAVTPDASASVIARGRWALGLAATAEGDFETAYDQLRLLFDADGLPVHYHVTPLAIADLAAAAARTGHSVAHLVDRVVPATRRQHNLVARARALAAPDEAEDLFRTALEDSGPWPFEQAATQLDYGEWLRRRGRRADARLPLRSALETFRRLGSRPWAERTVTELRAAGVRAEPAGSAPLLKLTPQQQVIVELAAKGLSNKEIGERLFLSARTVGSHLYRVFPKLGVTSRAQLRERLEADT